MRKPAKLEERRREAVITMVREIFAKLKSSGHILRSMIPISLMARCLDVMVIRRERQRLEKEVVATYAVGRMAIKGAVN